MTWAAHSRCDQRHGVSGGQSQGEYLWNDKIRGHRRDSNDLIPDIAAVVQTNPVQTTQAKYTGVFGPRLVLESSFSVMDGQTNYSYQPGTPSDAIHRVDFTLGTQDLASRRHVTRTSQTVSLSQRGDERYPTVTMVDLRISRTFRFGDRRFVPQLDIFNIGNAATVVSVQNAVGGTYLDPREILSPRIIRVGFSLDF
jgi:hypothetical protein